MRMLLTVLNGSLKDRSPAALAVLGFGLIGLIGTVDFLTGYELSFSIFYLAPIALVTWFANRRIGFLLCGSSAVVWYFVDSASGHTYSLRIIAIWNAIVRLGFFAITAYLLGELKTHMTTQEALSKTDDLTQILNSRAFKEIANRIFPLAARHQHPTVLAYLDIDDFKTVNDRWGHSEGDRVLKAMAKTLSASLRSTDIVARMGGDEFAVLMPETGYAAAQLAVSRLHQALGQLAAIHQWPIGFSIGVAVFPTVPPSIDDAVKVADGLMYRAKRSGKDQIIYEPDAWPADR
jgi:diguanylate cyclase (GGDEF)-like protein